MKKLAVLVSGTGSLLEAMLEQGVSVAVVVADRPCRGLEIARTAGIQTELIQRPQLAFGPSEERDQYTEKVVQVLKSHDIDLVSMAGWMTVFGEPMFEEFEGRIVNSHPSLLPLYRGDRAVRQALEAGATESGCTIHWVTLDLDAGPTIAQRKVSVEPGDNEETLHERIKQVERKLYPEVLLDLMKA